MQGRKYIERERKRERERERYGFLINNHFKDWSRLDLLE
jgi:hypothetical protein